MKLLKRITGFVIIMGVIFLILQIAGKLPEKNIIAGPGVQFPPVQPQKEEAVAEAKTAELPKIETEEKKSEKDDKISKESNAPEKLKADLQESEVPQEKIIEEPPKTVHESSSQQEETEAVLQANDNKSENNLEKWKWSKEEAEPAKPGVINVSDQVFIELDKQRDQNSEKHETSDGLYGWGLVGKYEKPDLAVRILGGVPFAIDNSSPFYYRIYPASGQVKTNTVVDSAYSTVGIDAHDPKLRSCIRKAVQSNIVSVNPDRLKYYYLLSKSTEQYLLNRVVHAFEWYIQYSKLDEQKAENFRKAARLRLDIWQVKRESKGEMGAAVPVYFDHEGQKLFLPEEYFKNDSEVVRLGLNINPDIY